MNDSIGVPWWIRRWAMSHHPAWSLLAATGSGCSDDGNPGGALDGSAPTAEIVMGCPSLVEPVAHPGDDLGGDTYESFAIGFFQGYCNRCHASTVAEPDRNGAPLGYDWDQEASVRMHLSAIRDAATVFNYMPADYRFEPGVSPGPGVPSCNERLRLARWIDAHAP